MLAAEAEKQERSEHSSVILTGWLAVLSRGPVLLAAGLDDHDIGDRAPHHFPGNLPEHLAFLGAEAAVADDDEVRRVGSRDFEQGLRRAALDDPDALRLELLHRRAQRRPSGLFAVEFLPNAAPLLAGGPVAPSLGPVRGDDDQLRVRGGGDPGGMTDGLQGGWRPVGADYHAVVGCDMPRRPQRHYRGLLGLLGRVHPRHGYGAAPEQGAGEYDRVGTLAAEQVLEDPPERQRLDEHRDDDHHVHDAHVHAGALPGHHAGDHDVRDAHHGSPGDAEQNHGYEREVLV